MSRDFEAIMKSSDSVQTAITKNEVVSLPPGYLVGFDVRLRPDYTVLISAGAANVGGSLVQTGSDHQLEEADWVAPKINSTRHYYIYLTKDGFFKVDIVAPVWNDSLLYYEQPDMNWRAVGKIFLVSSQIVYAVKQVELKGSTVTVAPEGFTGEADYYCTGDNDQILINAAIQYLNSAFTGGTVQFLRGTFYTSSAILIDHDNIYLSGSDDWASVIETTGAFPSTGSTSYSIYIGLSVDNVGIRGLNIEDAKTTATSSVRIQTATNLLIRDCKIHNPLASAIYFDGADSAAKILNNSIKECGTGIYLYNATLDSVLINGNIIDGSGTSTVRGIIISSTSCNSLIISNNTIQDITYSGDCTGILNTCPGAVISGNKIIGVISTGAANSAMGIGLQDSTGCSVTGNVIDNVDNSTTAANGHGIYINTADQCTIASNNIRNCSGYGINVSSSSGTNNSIANNYCYNNGSDSTIANTNSNNFYDAGTDTQVYSNSWQSPVSGEPEQGELHWLPRSTNTLTSYFVNAVTTTAGWVSFTTSYPVGAKAMYANVQVVFVSSATGSCRHTVAFSDEYGSTPSYGTHHVLAGMTIYASAGGETIRQFIPCVIPLDANRKGYFYAETRTNATNCQVHIVGMGYTS